jgi:hypothetical protein
MIMGGIETPTSALFTLTLNSSPYPFAKRKMRSASQSQVAVLLLSLDQPDVRIIPRTGCSDLPSIDFCWSPSAHVVHTPPFEKIILSFQSIIGRAMVANGR